MKVMFVCHGNICRSPMGEMILRHMMRERGLQGVTVDSCAVSREEIGRGIYPQARAELTRRGVPCGEHRARQMTRADYDACDLLLGMDGANLSAMRRIAGGDPQGKMRLLMDFTPRPGEVSDPWYSGRFDTAFEDIWSGCEGVVRYLMEKQAGC